MAVSLMKIPPDAPLQPARVIRRRYGIREWKLQRFALANMIRTETEFVPITLYHVDDLMSVMEQADKLFRGESPRPAQPAVSEPGK